MAVEGNKSRVEGEGYGGDHQMSFLTNKSNE